jgi:CubicO group peptidase (beta-lactamase class C family)
MKKVFSYFNLLITLLLSGKAGQTFAQDTKERNALMFTKVRDLINTQKGDSLYALLNNDFQAKFTKDVFMGILKNNLYPLGAIKESSSIDYGTGISSYKAVCTDAVLEFKIGTDKAGKISALRFLPFAERAAPKNYVVPSNNPMKTALDSAVDQIARQYINKATTVGLSIGIVKDGRVTTYGYGSTTKEKNNIPGDEAVFEIGSISKTFTATLLAYYAHAHKVALSDPIVKYLPDSVAANKNLENITLQMLANHTSGLPRVPENLVLNMSTMLDPYKNYHKAQLYAYLKDCKPESIPGEKYAYSNLGTGLLGTILEGVSGLTYEQMIIEVICKPLGMTSTYQHPSTAQQQRQVNVHNEKADVVNMWDMDALAGAGAIRSTTNDMLEYCMANMEKNKSDLSQAIEMTHHVTYVGDMSIGLGWHMKKEPHMVYWHNGGTGGCSSYACMVPDKKIALVVLSNATESTDATALGILSKLSE